MTRRDSALVLALVASLAIVAVLLVGASAFRPAATPAPTDPPVAGVVDRPYREGVLGHPASISPLTARTQADRDLVALLFAGLVRNGPNGSVVPDLAARWSTDEKGRTWTFEIRDDATWHDGQPVTAADVAFTIHTLQDPDYAGPRATSWSGVTVQAIGERTVRFTLDTPIGGFLQAATQPLAPAHLLADVPVTSLPDHPFGERPIGSGRFALVSRERDLVVLRPPEAPSAESPLVDPAVDPTDSLATIAPTTRPEVPRPFVDGIEFHYYEDADALAADYAAGRLDAVSGVDPAVAAAIAEPGDSRLLRYPGSTLTAVMFNLRPGHAAFSSPAARIGLLRAIDRERLIDEAFGGSGVRADSLIPTSSPLFSGAAAPPVEYNLEDAGKALRKAGWKRVDGQWRLPRQKEPFEVELLSPDEDSNPAAFAAAAAVARDWNAFGLSVKHMALPPAEFVGQRLMRGEFDVAVGDIAIGLDPDLYPLLASTQTVSGGSNVIGVQDSTLDRLLAAARAPGTEAERKGAYADLQEHLAQDRYVLPLVFADETMVVHDVVAGPVVRQVSDPSDRFWDVLTWRLADDR
jgi:peptide/nickel transport system substrate-binding protein